MDIQPWRKLTLSTSMQNSLKQDLTLPNLRCVILVTLLFTSSFIIYSFKVVMVTEPQYLALKIPYLHRESNISNRGTGTTLTCTNYSDKCVTFGSAISVDKKRYLCPNFEGRLGNIMFIYASTYGIAFDHNFTVVVSRRNELYEGFENIPVQYLSTCNCSDDAQFIQEKFPRIHEKFNFSIKHTVYRIKGFLQSWKYFKRSFADIKQQFVFKQSIRTKVRKTLQGLALSMFPNKTVTTVGIHVRRGDFVREHLVVPKKEYFDRAKQYFLNKYQNVLFIVATSPIEEDRKWCKDHIMNGNGKAVFSGFNDRYEDMAILTMTDHVITSVGTFGWWSGFLNNGTVIYYDWIPKDHRRFNRNDYVIPSWIGLKPNT
ncbi:galactoside 2-alpha-L-fucosyltransferase 2-like isoform X2 [Mizuhopecten yessoensis]|uniref:galactoside 2-alpha-L-fucosyltransferase 2-like isoform X2 n=1 Tax=Mizuhopecten yessoensis TaxID=6573 RepID=UPI000B45D6EE|nr:galactoside 2-alpha-L-fucosyltransferase 2-like isoform X2 [Mizuhopecten yessoensis]XP_021352965.1 galactoside 2-alpha-L-fucosyltransferase 2-like isoform X2 [Mizuhopecten yessoensis]